MGEEKKIGTHKTLLLRGHFRTMNSKRGPLYPAPCRYQMGLSMDISGYRSLIYLKILNVHELMNVLDNLMETQRARLDEQNNQLLL